MPGPRRSALAALPALLEQKLTKTGYTRGAAPNEIYQNRVTRNNTVLIRWRDWEQCKSPDDGTGGYEKGFIVLVEPSWYFETADADAQLDVEGVEIGVNALLLFQRRSDWDKYSLPEGSSLPNGKPFRVATSRRNPLGGTYFARVHATVSQGVSQIQTGYNTSSLRGAGIRVYEYASTDTIRAARLQLEALLWLCNDAEEAVVSEGMALDGARDRRKAQFLAAKKAGLLDLDRLRRLRIINDQGHTICPLCRLEISAIGLMTRGEQAEGRDTYDLTITELGLFHIQELRVGRLQHKPYNLAWGHHYCNVVVGDAGIKSTLRWMTMVIENQGGLERLEEEAESVEEAVEG